MAQDPYRYFRLEARDLLDQFAKAVLELERGGGGAVIQRLLRLAHTLKGAARVVKLPGIADRAHGIEDALAPLRGIEGTVPREAIEAILGHLQVIGEQIPPLAPVETAEVAHAKVPADDGLRTVRADIGDMDALLHGVSEAHARLNGLRTVVEAMEREQNLADLLVAQLASRGPADSAQPTLDTAGPVFAIADELRNSLDRRSRSLAVATEQMDRELHELRDAAEQLRLVPVATLFTALERTARDTARALSKQVVFEGRGGELRLDAHVLGSIQDALVQIVRNAAAHGIEGEAGRRAAGKPIAGRIAVDAFRRGRRIVFECRDDGRGVDLEAVKRIARERGLLAGDAPLAGTDVLLRLLLRGGISTAAAVTETSGRGVGLDVVRAAVEQLGGDVVVHSDPGKGTVFQLVVPSTLASTEVLKVDSAGATVAIPVDAIRRSIRVAAADISRTASGASVPFEGRAVPFLPLATALNGTRLPAGRDWTAVVMSGSDGLAAVGVDRLVDISRIVVRPLPDLAPANAIVAGAALDAEGNPQLVLDPDALAADAHRGDFAALAPVASRRPVLVIDDSLTTRMLEQSILESAGYDVDLALSGEEGLEAARRKRYALFLVDVEMPGMDGFTFVEQIRSDPSLHDIPAVLVTSRAAPEDRRRGHAVGAQGYIVKSEFDQAQLLTMIRPLAG